MANLPSNSRTLMDGRAHTSQSNSSTDRPSIWFTSFGDIDNLSRDRLLSRKNQGYLGPSQRMAGAGLWSSEIIGEVICIR
ncbi:hypothetical protein TNCV_519191 [Trichonephila clavipes]|nr:hypothetical protein TNCV_519191 [Trichonephila clavipes]